MYSYKTQNISRHKSKELYVTKGCRTKKSTNLLFRFASIHNKHNILNSNTTKKGRLEIEQMDNCIRF